ncbi:hypothetical protein [Mammaliicoccus sp. JADD-157]|uniref:hypothetical protein n=1 Tax=Mammaliicoccus sp. JADD-157 TaxID=3404818 RepID=UPI003BB493B5
MATQQDRSIIGVMFFDENGEQRRVYCLAGTTHVIADNGSIHEIDGIDEIVITDDKLKRNGDE